MRTKEIIFLLILTFMVQYSFACTCDYPDSTNIGEWIKEADYVIEGSYLTNLSPNHEDLILSNHMKSGYNILFKVTSVIKGQISSDTLAIVQFKNGNCTQFFKQGETYLVFGYRIKKIKCQTFNHSSQISDTIVHEIPTSEQPPPPGLLKNRVMSLFDCLQEEQDYWSAVINNYQTIYTSYCSTFNPNSEAGKLIKRK